MTPIQLVTMASTIANGGDYLPPISCWKKPDQKGNRLCRPRFILKKSSGYAATGRASRDHHHDSGRNAQHDGRRGNLRHRKYRATEWL